MDGAAEEIAAEVTVAANRNLEHKKHLTKSWWFSPSGAWTLSAPHNKSVRPYMIRATILAFAMFLALAAKGETMSIQDHPRYGENPIYIFFEAYIQDVIGFLTKEKSESFQQMDIQKVFGTKATEWHEVLEETLHLSETIQVAILDLWYRNREQFKTESGDYDPVWFSQIFTDEFMKDGSQVDVWPEGALEAAKLRIKQAESVN